MSDRRTFLGNAAAAAFIAKISPLSSFGFTPDDPQTIHPTISDREKAGLRGPVKQYTEESIISGIEGRPEIRSSQTTEYDPDGRILSTANISKDGSKGWVTTNIYDDNGRLAKTISGSATEPGTETLYAYDEAGRLLTTRHMNPGFSDWVSTRSYDEAGRVTKIISGKAGELASETLYAYDEKGRVAEVWNVKGGELPNREGVVVAMDFSADPPGGGIDVAPGGKVTALHDDFGQWTELSSFDDQGRLIAKSVRKYDANSRIIEESISLENPALLFIDKMASERGIKLDDKQKDALNRGLKLIVGGRKGTGVWYSYDSQGRIVEVCRRNMVVEAVTEVSYNEHGDKNAQRVTMARNSADPDVTAYSIDQNGTIIPERRTTEATESPGLDLRALAGENEVRYEYEYDGYGNWTQQTENPDRPYHVHVRHRKLTYY